MDSFNQFTNPFAIGESKDNVFCLSSGQPATDKVSSDLLSYVDSGEAAAAEFIKSRLVNKTIKFHDTLKRLNLSTFKSMSVLKRMSTSHKKNFAIKAERNLLGRLVFLAQENDINLEKLFEYPLGPIPWSLATADGSMIKTNKAQLMHHLESLVSCETVDLHSKLSVVNIVDGNALLQSLTNLPDNFENLAFKVFNSLPKSRIVHFVTDSYKAVSIKQSERSRRGQSATFNIAGSKTKVPRDFKAFMHNAENKKQLIKLLLVEWSSNVKYAASLFGRTVYFVDEVECWSLTSDGIRIVKEKVPGLCSDHKEADTRIILHCFHAENSVQTETQVVVRSPDTDVLVLLLYYVGRLSSKLFFDTGSGNKRRVISVNAIAEVLGVDVCSALPAYHAFSGCDYTSSFVRRGKVKPFELLKKTPSFLQTFGDLGSAETFSCEQSMALERFVCAMYGKAQFSDCNALRYKLFQGRYDVKTSEKAFNLSNGIDLCMLPPCRSSLRMHCMRSNYVAYTWKTAHVPFQNLQSPAGIGWIFGAGGKLEVQWTSGRILPQQLADVLYGSETEVSSEETDEFEVDNIIDVVFDDDEDLDP
jgi:hypothetical protein